MAAAYQCKDLDMMREATGNWQETGDINYIWTSGGRMALLLNPIVDVNNEDGLLNYDTSLRAWTADLEKLHQKLMTHLAVQRAQAEGEDLAALDEEMAEFAATNICDQGDWSKGVSLVPYPKFFVVTKWIKKYFPALFDVANKMSFYKAPGTKAPPFVQIKVHRTCFFFKGRDGPGSVIVNPELAVPGLNKLRDNLSWEVYNETQFTVEIIGGKTKEFPDGLSGKLTYLGGEIFVIPMSPLLTKKFDPLGEDDGANSYFAFKCSHPKAFCNE